MRSLLDINILIALLDEDHAFHQRAHEWWGDELPAWASCPLTENGVVRIMSSTAYSQNTQFSVATIVSRLQSFASATEHVFWEDSVSVRDQTRFEHDRILSSKTLTDLYLLALAVKNGGRLVTFDRGISPGAVCNSRSENLLVL